jgi:cell division ATPase FtsA
MSIFGLRRGSGRYGVIFDIGSGSVLAAIIHSAPDMQHPEVIWSHREHAPLRNIDSLEQSSKAVMTALMNASMRVDTDGRKALYDYNRSAKLSELQCSISAPWSYTVTKSVDYKQEESFRVTKELIEDLEDAVEQRIEDELRENSLTADLGLQVVTQMTTGLTVNGYQIPHPEGQQAMELSISHTSAVSQSYLIEAMEGLREKMFPGLSARYTSFVLLLYTVVREFLPMGRDVCFVNVTYEATEIGLVRDGILTYATHTPFGSFSLAREISSVTNMPLHEAFAHLRSNAAYDFKQNANKRQQKDLDAIFEAYTERLIELLRQTGDDLSVPKHIYLHTDARSESVFQDLIERAIKRLLKVSPHTTLVSSELCALQQQNITKNVTTNKVFPDATLLLSSQFFHMDRSRIDYRAK